MPIFSNRTIARMIDELTSEARSTYAPDWLSRISIGGSTATAAEWELLIVYQLATTRQLELVPATHGRARPDAIFVSAQTGERAAIEVTAISDDDFDERYPSSEFSRLFYQGLRTLRDEHIGSFDIDYSGPVSEDGQPTLALPERKDLPSFFASKEVRQYLLEIAAAPEVRRTFQYRTSAATTTVTYKPGAATSFSGGAPYQARLFNQFTEKRLLRRIARKAKQINGSGLELPSILVLCDNDCHILRHPKSASWEKKGTLESVADHIQGRPTIRHGPWIERGAQQQTTAMNAVFTLWVEEIRNGHGSVDRGLAGALVPNNRKAKHPLSSEAIQQFAAVLNQTPAFRRSPVNAKQPPRWPENFGAYVMTGSKIRISMLSLQDLLSGRMSYADFAREHTFPIEQIQRLAASGRSMRSAQIVPSPEVDDDWIEFDFSAPDPRSLQALVNASSAIEDNQ